MNDDEIVKDCVGKKNQEMSDYGADSWFDGEDIRVIKKAIKDIQAIEKAIKLARADERAKFIKELAKYKIKESKYGRMLVEKGAIYIRPKDFAKMED